MKMKVSIAAKTLSNAMTAATESVIAQNIGLASKAIDTAEFIHDINDLFGSFNSSNITKKLRIALTKKTKKQKKNDIIFWNRMLDRGTSILKKTVLQNERLHVERDG
jgi:hypothetical protein